MAIDMVFIREKELYNYFKENINWVCPCEHFKCWLHKFFEEFKRTFDSKWMMYNER